jgi:hypothetical protein
MEGPYPLYILPLQVTAAVSLLPWLKQETASFPYLLLLQLSNIEDRAWNIL